MFNFYFGHRFNEEWVVPGGSLLVKLYAGQRFNEKRDVFGVFIKWIWSTVL